MGGGSCSCCDLTSSKVQEISITSPKNKLSLLGFNILQSPKSANPEQELENRIKSLQALLVSTSLKLKVINAGNLPKGTVFIIKPQGLENSVRNKQDGYTYFGCKRKFENLIMNDVVIPLNDRQLTNSQRGRNFMIYYNIEKDSF